MRAWRAEHAHRPLSRMIGSSRECAQQVCVRGNELRSPSSSRRQDVDTIHHCDCAELSLLLSLSSTRSPPATPISKVIGYNWSRFSLTPEQSKKLAVVLLIFGIVFVSVRIAAAAATAAAAIHAHSLTRAGLRRALQSHVVKQCGS
jgi:hypothetical protein